MNKILLFTSILFLTISTSLFAQHPTNLLASNITPTTADLTFDASMCTGNINFRYRVNGTPTWSANTPITPPYILTGLTTNTVYEWQVKCVGASGWAASVTFTTTITSSSDPVIDSVVIANPLLCYGDLTDITVYITQTTPSSTPIVYSLQMQNPSNGFYFQIGQAPLPPNTTFGTVQPFTNLGAGLYQIRLKNASGGYIPNATFPFTISQPDSLIVSTTSVTQLQCYGDCDASEKITISGGTPPYSITINGITSLLGMTSTDTTYSALCAGTYNATITDVNSCSASMASFTIAPAPSAIITNGSISSNSNHNGQNISCVGALDGEITASASGGAGAFTYSKDGLTFQSSAVFSGLSAGPYTITYKDANGCIATENFTLNDPPVLSGTIIIPFASDSVSCNGVSDGKIRFIVNAINTGTPGGYSYSIDGGANWQTNKNFNGLPGGITYTIIIKDVNGCESSASIFLPDPAPIVFSVSSLSFNGFGVSCNGASDGVITASASGGTGALTYSIDGTTFQNSPIFSGLSAAVIPYTIIVKDAHGCTENTTITITQPSLFSISAAATVFPSYNGSDVSCYDVCDGGVTVTELGGVGLITYTMTSFPPQTSPLWAGVCGDLSYTIDATDANLCPATTTITLTEPLPWAYTVDSIAETCVGNGQTSINVTQGGTGAPTYLWNDPNAQATATATLLVTGMYSVTVADANSCSFTEDVFVGVDTIALSFTVTPSCYNLTTGSASVNVTGGLPPYTYNWNTTTSTNDPDSIFGVPGGMPYYVTVTDATGCSVLNEPVYIPTNPEIIATLDLGASMLDVACFGYPSSGVTIDTVTGGTGPGTYLYHIPNISPTLQASNTFSGLYAGIYPFVVTDFIGCSDTVVVTITEPDQLIFSTLSQDVSCNAGADGIAWINTISGGTQPYSYLWSTGAIIDSISNLTAGTYSVQVTDANGCLSNPTSDTITIIEPPVLQSSINIVSHATCDSSQTLFTGEISVTGIGGEPGYLYLWSTGSTATSINFLMPGIYTVIITDANGCTVSDTAEILPGTNPDLVVVIQNVSCFGAGDGMMSTSATGGTSPYQFTADGGSSFFPAGTSFGPSGQASYFITVVDSLGCTDSDSVHVNEPDLLQITSVNIQDVSCYDSANGELEVIFIGGTAPFTYLWNPGGQTTQTATNLVPGNYSVSVIDTNNCTANSLPVAITQPDSLYISALTFTAVLCNGDNTGTATVVAAGGAPNYSYAWSSGSSTDVASNIFAGTHSVQISDINGCSRNASITVTEPPAALAIWQILHSNVTCVGGADGSATVFLTNNSGTAPYTYLWDNGDITPLADTLDSGYHTVTITDANLCVLIDSVNILEPASSITIDSLIISGVTCFNDQDASITILASGGQLPYDYSNNNGFNTQLVNVFDPLQPNIYIMYVEDDYGCIDTDTVEIVNPDSLYIDTVVFSNVSCYGWNNGSIQAISVFGGTAPYMYAVNGGATHANMAYFNGYGPGTYTVEVFDVNNCAAQDIIIITQPDALDVTITTSNWNSYQIQCNGDSSGTAAIVVTGGQSPYIYTVLDINGDTIESSTNSNISGLTTGTYTFVITDANGCIDTETIIYNEPSPIVHTFIATHVSCSGWSNGSLTDVVSGGVGTATSYSYTWSPSGSNTYSLTSIPVGIYTMTVVDENNCTSIDSHTINANNALNVTANGTDVTCYNYCDGIIIANATGGMPNINSNGVPVYSYQWDDILLQNTAAAIGLCIDNTSNSSTYSCIVTDGQGCTDTLEYILNQPEELIITASILAEISCNLDNDGKLTAAVTGGNGGTTYLWNNWTTWNGNPINNTLSVGSYVVVAKDVNGCMDTTEIYLSEPSALSIVISSEIDVSCFGFGDGTITADADGGTPINGIPPKYDYTWSNSFNEQIDISTAIGLISGIYTVTAEDANGCTITSQSVYITSPSNPLSILVDSTDETCALNDGSATAFVFGGTLPYAYAWSNGGITNPQINLVPGLYTVDVTDANGCTISDETFVNGVQNIFLPGNLSSIDSTVCLGTPIFLEIEEKPNLNYVWEDGSTVVDRLVTPTDFVNVYILSITDSNCANAYTVTATINVESVDPLPSTNPLPANGPYATIVKGESIEIFSDNMNCDAYEWSWISDTVGTRIITPIPESSGWYHIAVDSAGCLGFDSVYVVVGVKPYDAITPNGDGFNDVWNILDIASYPTAIVQVFNRWGALVHETSGGLDYVSWDGTREGKELPVGTYYYIIDLNTGDEPQSGPITIIR